MANQYDRLDWTGPEDLEVGRTADVPIRLASSLIIVRCRVIDRRAVYGRIEWKIAPVTGKGEAWVQDASFAADGIRAVTPSVKDRHPESNFDEWDKAEKARKKAAKDARVKDAADQANAEATAPGMASRNVRPL